MGVRFTWTNLNGILPLIHTYHTVYCQMGLGMCIVKLDKTLNLMVSTGFVTVFSVNINAAVFSK